MSRRKLPALREITIEDIAAEGKSIARVEGVVVFVKDAVPGDVVNLQVVRKRKKFWEAVVTEYISYSDLRVEPFCTHFGTCGGCKWQHLPYQEQLRFKEQQVKDSLIRIGKIQIGEMYPIAGSERTEFYRNKLEYTFSNHRWLTNTETAEDTEITNRNGLGFHVPGRFDRVVDVEKCFLQEDPSNAIRNAARDFALSHDLSFYDHKTNEGLLRNLIIRTASTGEIMVILSVQFDEKPIYEMLEYIDQQVPGITSLMYVVNPKKNETLFDQEIIVYKGRDHIIEKLDELEFKIGPKSFFQTNTMQALNLYRIARNFAGDTGEEVIYDLYTGTGTIANFMAGSAKRVVGIESVPEAINDARINASLNNISNVEFHVGDMKDVFTDEFIQSNGSPDIVITDPPRAGMHPDVVEALLRARPAKIVYVSCNPATQARDIQILSPGYRVAKSQAVDMFPHTHHIENVVLLERI